MKLSFVVLLLITAACGKLELSPEEYGGTNRDFYYRYKNFGNSYSNPYYGPQGRPSPYYGVPGSQNPYYGPSTEPTRHTVEVLCQYRPGGIFMGRGSEMYFK